MTASLVAWMVLTALPPPPTDDGVACQQWALEAARELLVAPQPRASALAGEAIEGLSAISEGDWKALGTLGLPPNEADRARWRAVKEGAAPASSVPLIEAALVSSEKPLSRVLHAALGPKNRLPDSWQVWCALDCPELGSIDRARWDVPVLGLAAGWRSLARSEPEDTALSCLGVGGFLRAIAGTHLLGQMLAASHVRAMSQQCLMAARALPPSRRRELVASFERLEREWPTFSHTLTQELVFGQMLGLAHWPGELRSKLPSQWLALSSRAEGLFGDRSTWSSIRAALFGRLAVRERCQQAARAVGAADALPTSADPLLRATGSPTVLSRLAFEGGDASNLLGFVRRHRRLQTEIRMLTTALRDSGGEPSSLSLDARTEHALELRGSGADRVVVAPADPVFEEEELRLPVPEGTPTRP